ncbi:MAG TPA: TolC family protein [Saprospiraceae bacterium]|nr:TolC family protein [Saprospiraceae bacterium]
MDKSYFYRSFSLVFFMFCLVSFGLSQDVKNYSSLEEVWKDVKQSNTLFRNAAIQSELADLARKTAIGNVINPRMPVSFTMLDNTRLQNNFIPAEIFGGPAGTFREVTFGQQYNALLSFQPQFDIFNLSAISQIKSAKINQELTESQNLLNEMTLYESVNATYYNIVSLKNQQKILNQNIEIATQIKAKVNERYQEGIIRKQDVNEAVVNLIALRDKLEQLNYTISLQENILSLFLENKYKPDVNEDLNTYILDNVPIPTSSNIQYKNATLQSKMVLQDIKVLQHQYYPTLSFTSSLNWQNLSNDFFFANNSTGIHYNFIGLKIGWDLPTVQRLSSIKNKKYQLQTLANNELHIQNETKSKDQQLALEYEKAQKQWTNFKSIADLKEDTYQKNLNQYNENILPLDRLLTSQNDMLNSQLNVVVALANIAFAKHKIIIHNQY